MNSPGIIRIIVMGFALALSACGGGGDEDQGGAAGSQPTQTGIGAAGGTVVGPSGSKVEIPSGALAVVTQIAVDLTTAGAPPLPASLTPIGQMFAFTPHGTTFAVPVTITIPFDPGAVPAGATVSLFKTNAQSQWQKVVNATFGANSVSGQVTSFSDVQAVIELERTEFIRTFIFSELRNHGQGLFGTQPPVEVERTSPPAGDAAKVRDFGGASFDLEFPLLDGTSLTSNRIANGVVASGADGRAFQVAAEAPGGNANIEGEVIGGAAELIQDQTFIKREANATLEFRLPLARIETHDENAALGRECSGSKCNFIQGDLSYEIEAYRTDTLESNTFFKVGGTLTLHGFAEHWDSDPTTDIGSHAAFWNDSDLTFRKESPNGASESHAILTLDTPRIFTVDLSKLEVGTEFHVHIGAKASAHNRLAGPPSERPTSAGAYLNFEAQGAGGGGPMIISTGLESVATVDPPDPPPLVLPPACDSGPAFAGTLQFSTGTYTTRETNDPPTVTVTRIGGTNGPVTAVFTTSNGSATEGADYEPVIATVFFGDGDAEPRVAVIPIIEDSIAESSETVQLTLSQPGACGVLGSQDSAVLTIVDDDTLPGPSGIDLTFGAAGEATIKGFGGDRSGMALQPDNKVVMVGGTFTNFIMARFNADGTPDAGFDNVGKVTTFIAGSDPSLPQEALAVAVQRDNKIVVAGHATIPRPDGRTAIALVRYKSDGSIDTTFGNGGFVFGPTFLFGRAFAVAIDGDDRIVVAGDTPKAGNTDFGDFIVARFNANGVIDSSFGEAGIAVTDIGGRTNEAHGLKVLADNSLVVSGFAPLVVSNSNGTTVQSDPFTAVVRYRENGTLDTTFGTLGRVQLPGDNVGRGLAVQSDGRIVLAGSVGIGTFPAIVNRFALMRLLANGGIDDSFGNRGRVETSFTDRGDAAFGVALQADGKIVAGGVSNTQTNSNFAVVRYNRDDGAVDSTFATGGKLTIDFFGFTDIAENIAIQSDGKIVLGGLARDNVDGYGVARVLP